MTKRDMLHQEQRLDEILFSNVDPVTKAQLITRLGFDPEVADDLVSRHLAGNQMPEYYERIDYERIDFADLDDETEPFVDGHDEHAR